MKQSLKPEISIKDPLFSRENVSSHMLAVDLSWDRIAYALFDPARKEWSAFEYYLTGKLQLAGQLLDKIKMSIECSLLLNSGYRQIRVIWGGLQYTLVPEPLFLPENSDEYLKFTNTLYAGDEICCDPVRKMNIMNVYAIPAIIKEGLQRLLPGSILQHRTSCLLENLLLHHKNSENNPAVFIQVDAQSFDLIMMDTGKLIYCNSFEYRNAEDFVYYVLFAYEQLKINPAQSTVMLCGEIMKPSKVTDYLEKYINSVRFMERHAEPGCSPVFNELPDQMFYNLLNLFPCE